MLMGGKGAGGWVGVGVGGTHDVAYRGDITIALASLLRKPHTGRCTPRKPRDRAFSLGNVALQREQKHNNRTRPIVDKTSRQLLSRRNIGEQAIIFVYANIVVLL